MADVSIGTIQELVAFSNGDYGRGASGSPISVVLTADLDFNDLKEYDAAYNWTGCTGTWYINFDGQGHKIDNIYYAGSADWGFFYETNGGSIKNLKLPNMYVTTTASCGVVTNHSGGTSFENIHISGDITASGYCACFSAYNGTNNGSITITNCSLAGSIRSMSTYCSILFSEGYSRSATVNGFAANCNIQNSNANLHLWESNASGTYIANAYFIGTAKSTGAVNASAYNGTVINAYYVFKQGTKSSVGVVGTNVNCYYDGDVAGASGVSVGGLTSATTEELQSAQWLREHNFAV